MDELLAKIEGWLIEYGQHDRKFKLGDTIEYTPSEITNILRIKMTNLDIVPVRHGRWFELATYDGCEVDLMCGSCGATVSGFVQDYKYCPYCGAKMNEV